MALFRWVVIGACLLLVQPAFGQSKDTKSKGDSRRKSSKRKKDGAKAKRTKSSDVDMSAVPADEAAEKKALSSLGAEFKTRRTRHYAVLYDTGEKDLDVFCLAIERTYRSCVKYSSKLGIEVRKPKRKLMIFYFDKHAAYSAHSVKLGMGPRPQRTPGFYSPHQNVGMFYNFRNQDSFRQARESAERQIAQLKDRLKSARSAEERRGIRRQMEQARAQANHSNVVGGDLNERIIQHEVAHQVLWNIGFHNPGQYLANPRWLAEGTALLFEPVAKGNSANIGRVNKLQLGEYRRYVDAGQLFPLRDFLAGDKHFEPQTMSRAYAQAWGLVHYLNRVKKKKLRVYIALINKRPKRYRPSPDREIEEFETAFGKVDRTWEAKWKTWMKRVR